MISPVLLVALILNSSQTSRIILVPSLIVLSSLCVVFLSLQFITGMVIYYYFHQKVTSESTLNFSGTKIYRFVVHREICER